MTRLLLGGSEQPLHPFALAAGKFPEGDAEVGAGPVAPMPADGPATSRQIRDDASASASSRNGPPSVAPAATSSGASGSTHRTPCSLRSTSPTVRVVFSHRMCARPASRTRARSRRSAATGSRAAAQTGRWPWPLAGGSIDALVGVSRRSCERTFLAVRLRYGDGGSDLRLKRSQAERRAGARRLPTKSMSQVRRSEGDRSDQFAGMRRTYAGAFSAGSAVESPAPSRRHRGRLGKAHRHGARVVGQIEEARVVKPIRPGGADGLGDVRPAHPGEEVRDGAVGEHEVPDFAGYRASLLPRYATGTSITACTGPRRRRDARHAEPPRHRDQSSRASEKTIF